MPESALEKPKFDLLRGSDSFNPFDPPLQMTAHAASVVSLLLSIQRRRREKQVAAEVGVFQGQLSRWLLTCCPFLTLHMIDPWKTSNPGDSWYDNGDRFAKLPQEQFDAYHDAVQDLARQFAPRGHVYRESSLEAVTRFPDGYFDLVFIDAAHDKVNVRKDILAWHPKVRSGGYLSGHDYRKGGNYFGLVAAVEQATSDLSLEIELFKDQCRWPGKVWACKIS